MTCDDFELTEIDKDGETRWYKIVAHIRNNATGEVRRHENTAVGDEMCVPGEYIWSDGNYSCDCNRDLFWGGDNAECGATRYSVNLENPKTGEIYYREFE